MSKSSQLWLDTIDTIEALYVDGKITEDECEARICALVGLDETDYYMEAFNEARADHGQFWVGA